MNKAILLPFFIVLAYVASAQADSTNGKDLGEVVVTGQYKPQSVKSSVYQVRVITAQQIQKQAPSKLQDVLNNQLNIRFSQDLATGGSNLGMLGLSGQNVKVLIDGVPVIGRQGTSNEININQIEVNSIERIEIIEGPMSVVYGADALAGVINIITKKPRNESFSVNARVHEETVGKEYGFKQGIHNQYLGGTYNFRNWYFSGGVGRNLFQGWKDTAIGRELVWHKKDQIVANAVLGYRSGKLNVYYRIDGLDEIITNPANPPSPGQTAVDQDYMTDRIMQQVQGSYNFNSRLSASALASYTHFTRQVYSTLFYPNGDVRVATAPGLHSLSTFNGLTFRGSAVYRPSSIISFQPGVDINLETGEGERMKAGNQRINDYAFFITSEFTPTPGINIRPGLRFIKNSVYDAPPVIPSVNTKFRLGRNIDLRMAYARGFRSPSLRELYYDFFDASHSIKGNPFLEAEHSNSLTGSVDWSRDLKNNYKVKVILSVFYNDVKNMIDFAADAANPAITTYLNVARYKTRGATISAQLAHHNLEATAGVGYTGRYNSYAEENKNLAEFQWSPEANALVNYNFPKYGLGVNLYYKYTGRLPKYSFVDNNGVQELTLVKTEGYHWADFTVNKKLLKVLTINAGIRNLFDISNVNSSAATGGTAHATSGVQSIASGRSYFLGLAFSFTGKK